MDVLTTPELSVTLAMTPTLAAELQRETGALDVAHAYMIDSNDMAEAANVELKSRKAIITRLKELKSGFVAPAKTIIANAEALFDPAINANIEAEKYLKGQLTTWTTEQQRLADEARRAAEAEERKRRQEAERIAAEARARAEEQARAQMKLAQEAEERRLAAEREGNTRAAAAAAAEAAKANEKAASVVENAEAKAQEAILTAAATATAPVVEAPKLAGFSTRDNWTAELAAGFTEEHALRRIAHSFSGVLCDADGTRRLVAPRPELLSQLKRDTSAGDKLAKALKSAFNVPGLAAVNRPVAASRK